MTIAGLSRSTLKQIRGIMRPAYEMALQEDVVYKNLFNFSLDFIPDNSKSRDALSPEQQQKLLDFARTDPHSMQYYDMIVILLGTPFARRFAKIYVDLLNNKKSAIP